MLQACDHELLAAMLQANVSKGRENKMMTRYTTKFTNVQNPMSQGRRLREASRGACHRNSVIISLSFFTPLESSHMLLGLCEVTHEQQMTQ